MIITYSRQQIEARAKLKGKSYIPDLVACAISSDKVSMTFDTSNPCWAALKIKYADPAPDFFAQTQAVSARTPSTVTARPCGSCGKPKPAGHAPADPA